MQDDELEVSRRNVDGVLVITAAGDLSHETVHQVKDCLPARFDRASPGFVLDLMRCDYLDSGGLAFMLATLHRFKDGNGVLAVATANANVERLVDTVGLPDQRGFELYRDVDSAVKALAQRSQTARLRDVF